jgi:hypothetical protein
MLRRQGYILVRSARRDPLARDYDRYMIKDETGRIVAGADPHSFSMTIDDAEHWARQPPKVRSER